MTIREDGPSAEVQHELEEKANPKYWVKHMDYDLEDLIEDL